MNNILLVDDEPYNIRYLKRIINLKEKINFYESCDEKNIINKCLNNSIDLILLDINLKNISGFKIADLLKENSNTKNIPIIFITASAKELKKIKKGYSKGAIDYLIKPVNKFILNKKIEIFLEIINKTKILNTQIKENKAIKKQLDKNISIFNSINNSLKTTEFKNTNLSIKSHNTTLSNIIFNFNQLSQNKYSLVFCFMPENSLLTSLISIYFNGIMSEINQYSSLEEIGLFIFNSINTFNSFSKNILPYRFFISGIIMVIDTKKQTISYYNASKSSFFIKSDKKIFHLKSIESPFGLISKKNLRKETFNYKKTDILYLYTKEINLLIKEQICQKNILEEIKLDIRNSNNKYGLTTVYFF